MSLQKLDVVLNKKIQQLQLKGTLKGDERFITGIKAAENGYGERYYLQDYSGRAFLRMNSNSYLGLSLNSEVITAEADTVEKLGTGSGAVRFISGSFQIHRQLEQKLAEFHHKEAAMLFSSAYTTVTGVLPQLIDEQTLVVSDALNHNSIINAIRLSHPGQKTIYPHLDMSALENILNDHQGKFERVCVVTDGIFSMRGDFAPLDKINDLCEKYQPSYQQGIINIVDDSHGVGAFGKTGRGTEEYTQTKADILIATLGKAIGVNGGYVVASQSLINYLKETSPFYIYSNPITPAEAAAALKAIQIIDSSEGIGLLNKIKGLTIQLKSGLQRLGFETLETEHPIVAVLIRDTEKTASLVKHLFDNNIMVTGLNYPVVPEGEQEIRLQISANHTEKDIEYLLAVLKNF